MDALREEKVELEGLKDEDLPEEMRGMTPEQRKAYLEERASVREKLREQIRQLNEERKKFVAEKERELAAAGVETFDAALIRTLREQARGRGYEIEE